MTESTEEHDRNKKYPPVKPADLINEDKRRAEETNGEDPTSTATAEAMKTHTKVTNPTQSKDGQ